MNVLEGPVFFYLNKKTTRETTLASRFPLEEVETSGAAKTSLFFNVFLNSLLGGKIGASDGSTLLTEYKQKPVASVCFFHLASALLLLLSLLSEGNKKNISISIRMSIRFELEILDGMQKAGPATRVPANNTIKSVKIDGRARVRDIIKSIRARTYHGTRSFP